MTNYKGSLGTQARTFKPKSGIWRAKARHWCSKCGTTIFPGDTVTLVRGCYQHAPCKKRRKRSKKRFNMANYTMPGNPLPTHQ